MNYGCPAPKRGAFSVDFPEQSELSFLLLPCFERQIELTVATQALALHRTPALFLQIATEFATIGSMFSPSQPLPLVAEDKLAALRRLDKSRAWNSLDDQL